MYDRILRSPALPGEARRSPALPGEARRSPAKPGEARRSPARRSLSSVLWVRLERTYTMELTHVKHRLYRIPTFYRIFYPNRWLLVLSQHRINLTKCTGPRRSWTAFGNGAADSLALCWSFCHLLGDARILRYSETSPPRGSFASKSLGLEFR